jgi:hypothetical protein
MKFNDAIKTLSELRQAGIESGPVFQMAMEQFFTNAPPDVKDWILDEAIKNGIIPKPSGYSDDKPVWALTDLSKHFNKSESEMLIDLKQVDPKGLIESTLQRLH